MMRVFVNSNGSYYAAEIARSIADSEVVSPAPLLIKTLEELHSQNVTEVRIPDAEALLYKFRNMSPEELAKNFEEKPVAEEVSEQK